jgi:adenylate kinase family enzyme
MQAYEASTKPLIDFYAKRNLLVSVSANGTPAEICERSLTFLNGR